MGRSNGSRKCRQCGNKRRIDLANLMCAECNGLPPRYEFDESPMELRGRWVPNGRGTLDFVEQVA